jgi:hypothetical protein
MSDHHGCEKLLEKLGIRDGDVDFACTVIDELRGIASDHAAVIQALGFTSDATGDALVTAIEQLKAAAGGHDPHAE